MIASVELLPPPSDDIASIVGAGVSDDSGPLQSTTEPSEYVCRTVNMYVLLELGLARNWKTESSPVGTLPPLHVTFWITAFSPEPVCCSCRFQPAAGAKESMPKPPGGVSSTFVVVRPSFSVGTASVKSCRVFDLVTGGVISACAHALETTVRQTAATAVPTSARARARFGCMLLLSFRCGSRGGYRDGVRRSGADRARRARPRMRPRAAACPTAVAREQRSW